MKIKYFYDPLCGWCYAASPALERAEAQGIEVEALNVGLFAGSRGRLMTREFADHAWSNDQRVHDLTGQPFAADYREKVLTNFGARFDSWMPSLAISAHENRFKDGALRFLRAIHQARYVEALDVSDLRVLGAIAERLGWDQAEFSSSMRDRDLQRETEQKMRNNFLAFKSSPPGGVPLLVVRDNGVERIVSSSLINLRNPDPRSWFRRIAKVAI